MPLGFLLLIIYVVSLATMLGGTWLFARWRTANGVRRPVKDRMLRLAGTSLEERTNDLSGKMLMWFLSAVLVPMSVATALALGVNLQTPVPFPKASAALSLAALTFIPIAAAVFVVGRRRLNYELGLSGERLVAEHLQELARKGCYVFHDLQPEKTWNIDHIVVTPESVLVVETKTRRMRKRGNDTAAHEVVFDGRQLHFPQGSDTHGLQQAERNADWVRDFLGKALSEPVKVEPVLVLPGWMVRRKGRGPVYVVNPKEVRALVRARGSQTISPTQTKRMSQIAFALDQKCRDVEF